MISVDSRKTSCGTCQHWSGERQVDLSTRNRVKCDIATCPCKIRPGVRRQATNSSMDCLRKDYYKPWIDLP